MTQIYIALQRGENIVEMTLPYNISIFLPYLYCPTMGREHCRNYHSMRSLYCDKKAREQVEMIHISIALQWAENIVEMTGQRMIRIHCNM